MSKGGQDSALSIEAQPKFGNKLLCCALFLGNAMLLMTPLCVIVALILDGLIGEVRRFHPLVGFGRWAAWLERQGNRAHFSPVRQRLAGVMALVFALLPILLLWWWLWALLLTSPVLWALVQIVLLYFCLGWRSLQQHIEAILLPLRAQHLAVAQEKLSLIVSRNTHLLNEEQVAQAGVESLLENSLDALFASLFWFVLGGALAALLHRAVNTLDAMWGYRTERFYYFGWAAARLDDLLALVPARLTALSFVLVGEHKKLAWRAWREQARHCASPNGGPVMCAGAGTLAVRLSAGAFYQGQWQAKPPMGYGAMAHTEDILRAQRLIQRALVLWLSVILAGGALLWINA